MERNDDRPPTMDRPEGEPDSSVSSFDHVPQLPADSETADVALEPKRPTSVGRRIFAGLVWLFGIAVVLMLGRVLWLTSRDSSLSGFEQGVIFGSILGAVIGGLFIRWAWVAVRKRGRVISPWALVATAVLMAASLGRVTPTDPRTTTVPIELYLQVGAPWTIAAAPADVTAQVVSGFAGGGALQTEVREIRENGDAIGYLLVTNIGAGTSEGYWQGLEAGFEENPGVEAHRDRVGDTTVVIGTGPDAVMVSWVEAPYSVMILTIDQATGRLLAAAVMAGYRQ